MKKIMLLLFGIMFLLSFTSAQTKHTLGEKFGGGVIFEVSKNGLHGLIAETINQSDDCKWENIPSVIADTSNHSTDGRAYTDWRLPTKVELAKLAEKRGIVGGFIDGLYWGSVPNNNTLAFYMCFGSLTIGGDGIVAHHVRSIRSF
jgi:hypothetical protein